MKVDKIDDSLPKFELKVSESKRGVKRVNGKTQIQMLREYRDKYGVEKLLHMAEAHGIEIPKSIKLATKK